MSFVGDCHIDLENVEATNLVARFRCDSWLRAVAPTDRCFGKIRMNNLELLLYLCA